MRPSQRKSYFTKNLEKVSLFQLFSLAFSFIVILFFVCLTRLFSHISLPYFDVGNTPTYKHPSYTSYLGYSVLGEEFPTAVLEFLNNLWGLRTEKE
jgi:hypothetical protein